jgi:hypothetical protein
MKKIILLIVLLHEITYVFAQTDVSAVNKVITDYFEAISANDLDIQKQLTTENYIILENGVLWNHDTIVVMTNRLKGRSFKRINQIDFIRTEIKGNMAWVAYYNTADMTLDAKQRRVSWLESAVLIRERETWRIQLLHSTRLVPKT